VPGLRFHRQDQALEGRHAATHHYGQVAPLAGLDSGVRCNPGLGPFGTSAWATSSAALAGRLRSHFKTPASALVGLRPAKLRWEPVPSLRAKRCRLPGSHLKRCHRRCCDREDQARRCRHGGCNRLECLDRELHKRGSFQRSGRRSGLHTSRGSRHCCSPGRRHWCSSVRRLPPLPWRQHY